MKVLNLGGFAIAAILILGGCTSSTGEDEDDNEAPTANAGVDQIVAANILVSLDGSASSDSDGTITSYAWEQTSGTSVSLLNAITEQPTFTSPVVDDILVFQLTVTDDDGSVDVDNVSITVESGVVLNEPPVANAGADFNVDANATANLDGSASIDSDGTIVSYSWQQTSGTSISLNNATTAQPSFTAPNINGNLVFQLTVTDDDGASSSDSVTVTVENAVVSNDPPTANAGVDQTVDANTTVNLDGSASADGDGNIVSYSWQQISGTTVTINNDASAQASFITPNENGDLVFQLTVTDDDGAIDTDTVTITVENAIPPNEAPVANAGPNQTVTVDTTVSLNGSGSTDSDGNIVSYNWQQTSGTIVALSNSAIAQPSFTAPSGEVTLVFELTVTDDDGATDTDSVTVVVEAQSMVSGLDSRPDNMNCVAPATVGGVPSDIDFVDPFPNLNLSSIQFPLGMKQMPNNNQYFFIIHRDGQLFRFDNDPSVTTAIEVLDIEGQVSTLGSEGGLLGFAFHPDVATNRAVYFSYTQTGGGSAGQSVISRFTMSADFSSIDPSSERVVLTVNQPYSNHNGGDLHFGPDGYLYFGLGDGGSSDDPDGNGQNTNTLLGSMLRIDVDPITNNPPFYSIPGDNPFAGGGGQPEIYAYGLRNPFRWSFDTDTGTLWAADVGQGLREEIDHVVLGGNYGWVDMEGTNCRISDCSAFDGPIHEYGRSVGASITGGYVYRGSEIPNLDGIYIFGDYVAGNIWTLEPDGSGGYSRNSVESPSGAIVSFAQDNAGEVYVLLAFPGNGRSILKAQPSSGGGGGSTIPTLLSQTGCFNSSDPSQPNSGLIPYNVANQLWSDGAEKERWIALPNGETVDVDINGDFDFPVGTILAKSFENAGTLIETRLFMHHQTGWVGYSYQWRADQTDADLLTGALDATVAGLDWHFPSAAECRQCHTQVANFALGTEVLQLNNDFNYPQTGRTANQVFTLDDVGVFTASPDPSLDNATLFSLNDASATLEQRAKSYLHSNCAHCHQPGGTGEGGIDLRFNTAFADMGICGITPQQTLGNPNSRYIAPGSPSDSMILTRMQASSASGNRMPPLATSVVDAEAVTVFTDWINSIGACP